MTSLTPGRASVVAGSFKNRVQAEVATHLADAIKTPIMAGKAKPHG